MNSSVGIRALVQNESKNTQRIRCRNTDGADGAVIEREPAAQLKCSATRAGGRGKICIVKYAHTPGDGQGQSTQNDSWRSSAETKVFTSFSSTASDQIDMSRNAPTHESACMGLWSFVSRKVFMYGGSKLTEILTSISAWGHLSVFRSKKKLCALYGKWTECLHVVDPAGFEAHKKNDKKGAEEKKASKAVWITQQQSPTGLKLIHHVNNVI